MKHKTWFRLVLKAIGIFLIASAIPNVAGWVAFVLQSFLEEEFYAGYPLGTSFRWQPVTIIQSLVQVVIGLYLLLGGRWVVDRCIPSNRPYCPECGYDLSHNREPRCPECGVLLPPPPVATTQPLDRDARGEHAATDSPREGD